MPSSPASQLDGSLHWPSEAKESLSLARVEAYWMRLCLRKAPKVIEIRAKFILLVQTILSWQPHTDTKSQVFGFINGRKLNEES